MAVSGPAAPRFLRAVTEFQTTYEGAALSARQHKDLLNNPHLQVFDHPHAFLTCNYDPLKALCNPDHTTPAPSRTPSHDRCHRACANIARTDRHIDLARAESELLAAEISDNAVPLPIRRRLQQRQTALVSIITQHEATSRPTPPPPVSTT
ncbi:hypothetical protein ACWGCP_15400 [Streptomyces niveus]